LHWLCVRAARLSVCARCSLCFFFSLRAAAPIGRLTQPKGNKERERKKEKKNNKQKQNSGQASANQPSDRWTAPDQPTLPRNDNEPADATRAQRPLARRGAMQRRQQGRGAAGKPSRLI
jgi:hypothetical protein